MQRFPIILFLGISSFFVEANNLSIESITLNNESNIECQINWENSWFYHDSIAPYNHDAVWIFVKGKRRNSSEWETLKIEGSAHSIDNPLIIEPSADGLGAMVKRNTFGEGDIAAQLELNLINNAIASEFLEIRLFGIEMVYIEEGSFYIGDTASNNTLIESVSNTSYFVESEDEIEVGSSQGQLTSSDEFIPADNIPSDYPKGFNGFYTMKYEISQQQYAEFLNTLTTQQQVNRKLNTLVQTICFTPEDYIEGERNFIVEKDGVYGCDANQNGILNELDDGNSIACNFLNWSHLTAYLDWAGLRPMTEIEFEKICRGPLSTKPLELAWGNTNLVNTLQPELTATEEETVLDTIPSNAGIANFGYCLPAGPLRCGFAANDTTDRVSSGASYFGAMEMSGNLWELCVALNEKGILFEGNHGDGILDEDGFANESTWEAISGEASGFRGGGWNSGVLAGFRDLAISDRFFAFLNGNSLDRGTTGGRGVISKNRFE